MRLGSHERDQRGADQVPFATQVRSHDTRVVLGTVIVIKPHDACQDCLRLHVHGSSCDDVRGSVAAPSTRRTGGALHYE